MEILEVYLTYTDLQDGSQCVSLFNTKEEALEYLDRTEEQLENGCPYDDGIMVKKTIRLDRKDNQLILDKPFKFYTDDY